MVAQPGHCAPRGVRGGRRRVCPPPEVGGGSGWGPRLPVRCELRGPAPQTPAGTPGTTRYLGAWSRHACPTLRPPLAPGTPLFLSASLAALPLFSSTLWSEFNPTCQSAWIQNPISQMRVLRLPAQLPGGGGDSGFPPLPPPLLSCPSLSLSSRLFSGSPPAAPCP